MSKMYFKERIYQDGRMHPYVVWDGERDYQSPPSRGLVAAKELTDDYVVMLAGSSRFDLDLVVDAMGSHGSILIWTRDSAIYRAIVKMLEEQSDGRIC